VLGPLAGAKADTRGTAEARAGLRALDDPRSPLSAEASIRATAGATADVGLYTPVGAAAAPRAARGAPPERVVLPADRLRLFGVLARRRRRRAARRRRL
jgi:hypothetical protein